MVLGIPRGFFYYDYFGFVQKLFAASDTELIWGDENDDNALIAGNSLIVDEACFPVKLMAGQIKSLMDKCDKVLMPVMAQDIAGKWLCPKLLGLPALMSPLAENGKLIISEPLHLNDKPGSRRILKKLCTEAGMSRELFNKNFNRAYDYQRKIVSGEENTHIEAGWEFTPEIPADGEIILPNTSKILLAGHCYNVYDKFANSDIISRLDELCIEAVTEKAVSYPQKEQAVKSLNLIKNPFWESLIRTLGTAVYLRKQVDGVIYLSSFSCGPDAFIIELIRKYVPELPMMVIKLDEHKGEAGLETRLEAFADLLNRRRQVSW